jgi:uncharacterized membrane protein YebE (DUF533 family)
MSLLNNLVKATFVGGALVGGTVAYVRLNDEQKQKLHQRLNQLRREVADLIAPNDGAYTIPKEIEEELNALIND